MNRDFLVRLLLAACATVLLQTLAAPASAQSFGVNASSQLGSTGADEVTAVAIQSDGTILVGATIDGDPATGSAEPVGSADGGDQGVLFVLSVDGRTLERTLKVGASVHDMSLDQDDNIYIAAGASGMVQLDADLEWRRTKTVGNVFRVDAAGDYVVTLVPTNPDEAHDAAGPGELTLLDAESGAEVASFGGYQHALDVCLDAESERVGLIGWRADELEGLPIQVAFFRAYDFQGLVTWSGYDWGVEDGSEDYINSPGDNGDSTRGYRCSIGADGKLYAGFEADGPEHLFRYAPDDLSREVEIVGGDDFHEFEGTRGEEKVFFGRYESSDGEYLLGQQLVARVGNNAGNTVRLRRGAIEADAHGNVYLTGQSAFGLPLQYLPPGTGDYTGGAFLLAMNSDFSERLYATRVTPNGAGYAVAARPEVGAAGTVVYGGVNDLEEDQFFEANPYQTGPAGGAADGFVTIFGEGIDDMSGEDGGSGDGGCMTATRGRTPASFIMLCLLGLCFVRCTRRCR